MPRILIATVLGLSGFLIYVAAAVILADPITKLHWLIQLLYFIVAGSLWVFPVWGLMLWAARGREERPS